MTEPLHIAVIPGHGMRGGRWDPGATFDGHEEATVVRRLARYLFHLAPGRVTICDQVERGRRSYSSRRAAAGAAIAENGGHGVLVHLHCNALGSQPSGRYAFCAHDPRSELGGSYAARWQRSAREHYPRDLFRDRDLRVVSAGDDWPRVRAVLRRTYSETPAGVAAVLVELGFIDNPSHGPLWVGDGVDMLARTLADAWL